jgi:hypothetical protein
MSAKDYSIILSVNKTPKQVYKAICNIRAWWADEMEGEAEKLNDEFSVRFGDIHWSTQKLMEVIPGQKVVWLVTKSQLNFVEDKSEWTGTKICFDIRKAGDKTEIHFTHYGLVPAFQCYKGCEQGWDYYLKGSLFNYLTKGVGTPGLE